MNLVVGGTGILGSAVVQALLAQKKPVRALVRTPSKSAALAEKGAQLVTGDLKTPGSLTQALAGVKTVISTASSTLSRQDGDSIETVDLKGQLALIDAAEAAGVSHFIFLSFPHEATEFPLQSAKRAVEERLKKSKLAFTILRPTVFAEVWLSPPLGFDAQNQKARILGTGDAKIPWIALADVTAATVACVDNEKVKGATMHLGGPEKLSYHEVIAIFEELGKKPFQKEYVPVAALRAQHGASNDPMEKSFAGLMISTAEGPKFEQSTLVPPAKVTVREVAKRMLGV
jgi:uncharacterized protein YbjT (DUF2867 family)